MARHADHADSRDRRKVVGALVAIGGLVVTAGGVYAGLNATAFNGTAQTVTSGTLKLVMANGTGSAGFTSSITDMAPGDTVNRFVDVTDTGTISAQNLTLSVVDGTPTKLSTDSTNGLHVTVTSCSVPWVVNAGTNVGTCADPIPTVVANNVPLTTFSSAQTLVSGAVAKNAAYHYRVSVTLPDQNETTQNGTLPAGTIQGLSASLTWTFSEAQRAATTTNG